AQQRVGVPDLVPLDQGGVVEGVAGVHPHAGGQRPAQRDLALLVEQGDLDAVDPVGVLADQGEHGAGGAVEVGGAPVTGQCGVEHVPEPVQDNLSGRLTNESTVDGQVVVGVLRGGGELAAAHEHGYRARLPDVRALL